MKKKGEKKEKKKEEKEGIEGNREQWRGKKKGLGKERLRKKIWFWEKFVQKKYLWEKNGLWEN